MLLSADPLYATTPNGRALSCSHTAHCLPHPFCIEKPCHTLADVIFESSPLLAVLDSRDWTALAACSRPFRNLIHSLVKAATVTSQSEAEAILSGHWPRLVLVNIHPITQPESFYMPPSSEFQVLAILTVSSFDAPHLPYAKAFLVSHRAQQLDDQLRNITAAFPHLHSPAWQQAETLRVSISSDAIRQSSHVLAHVARMRLPSLLSLAVAGSKLGRAAAEHLARGAWPQLKWLDLSDNQLDEAALKALCQGDWPSMSDLTLNNNLLVNAAAIAHIPAAASWSLMTRLELDYVQLDSASLHAVAQMHLHLQFLSLCSCGLGAVAASDFPQKRWPCLLALSLSTNNLGADAIASLTWLFIPNIQSLNLRDNSLGTDAAEWLAKTSWHQLCSLYLDNNQFDNAAMACLARAQWPNLLHLYLSKNAISAHGVDFLTKGMWPALSKLRLSKTAISSVTWALLSLAADAMQKTSLCYCYSVPRDLSAQEGSVIWPRLETVDFWGF